MHIAIIGTGRVGRMVAFALAHEPYLKELSLSDIVPDLTKALAEEIRHTVASSLIPININAHKKNQEVEGADIIIVTAGMPRTPEMKDRKDLIQANARMIKSIAEEVVPKNKSAKFIIVTNPVDAMASLFAKYSQADFVISTGTSLDTLRFRAELAKQLQVPITQIEGFVAGEHGEKAVFLWSTVRVNKRPLEEYLKEKNIILNKQEIEDSVKQISRMIIQVLGGTSHGPAAAFREIISSIALNKNKLLPVAFPYQSSDIPESIHLSIPLKLGKGLGPTIEESLTLEEKEGIKEAAKAIWQTYQDAYSIA